MSAYKKSYIYNTNNQALIVEYQQISSFHEGLAVIQQGNKWGYINTKGEIEIPCQFNDAFDFSEGYAAVENINKRFGYINRKGEIVIPCLYTFTDQFSEGLAAIEDDTQSLVGYINSENKLLIKGKYKINDRFSEGLASVATEDKGDTLKFKYIDKEGKIIIDRNFEDASPFLNGFARVAQADQIIIINKAGEEIFKRTSKDKIIIENEGEILLTNENNQLYFYNLATGLKKALPQSIENVIAIRDNFTVLKDKSGKQGILNKDGDVLIPFRYDNLWVNEGTILFLENGMYGYMDYNGTIILPAQYDHAYNFSNGLALVQSGGNEYFIKKNGDIAFYVKQKESKKITLFIIGIIIFWIALIILVLI